MKMPPDGAGGIVGGGADVLWAEDSPDRKMFPFPPKGKSAAARSSSNSSMSTVLAKQQFKWRATRPDQAA